MGGGGDEGGCGGTFLLGFVVLPGLFCLFFFACGVLGVEFFGDGFDAGEHAFEGLEDLLGLFGAALVKTELEDVGSGPEHAEGGVSALMGGIHGADGVVGLLYAALLAQVENFFDSHIKTAWMWADGGLIN